MDDPQSRPASRAGSCPASGRALDPEEEPFPLFESGPFDPVHASLRLTGLEKRHIKRRIIAVILLTWVPLVVLAAVQGHAIGPTRSQSMLLDPAMYARYLVAMPLLIYATTGVRRKLRAIFFHFLDSGLVREQDRQSFLDNTSAILRWRDSKLAAAVILAIAVVKSVTVGTFSVAEMPDSWRVMGAAGHQSLSYAGWWQFAVCDTLYSILVLQLIYRLALLWRFFGKTAQLDLHLDAAHPDGAGGLAFLGIMFSSFRLPLFAIAASAAGALANLMLYMGVSFTEFRWAVGALVVGLLAIVSGPLLFFNPQLRRAKDRAVLGRGALSGRQLQAFEDKWLSQNPPGAREMLEAPDFSSVADLGATGATARSMNTLPFRLKQLVPLALAAILPFVPVAAIQTPLPEILKKMLKLVG